MTMPENGSRSVVIEVGALFKTDEDLWLPLYVDLSYDESDPLVITATFHQSNPDETPNDVIWVFARSLMAEGVEGRAGNGDVAFEKDQLDPSQLLLKLNSPAGRATIRLPKKAVETFLDRTFVVVAVGAENDLVAEDLELWLLLND